MLPPSAGLTIVVGWPKGFVVEPDRWQRLQWLLADNANLFAALVGLFAMLAYLIPTWRMFGRDPEEGLVVARYEPPQGFSPASLRFIKQMYYDNKVMTAAVVNLAVKGYLTIRESGDQHTLKKAPAEADRAPLAAGEQELFDALFKKNDVVILDDEYHGRIGGARKVHRRALRRDYRGRYFRTNGIVMVPALAIGLVSSLIALNLGRPTLFVGAGIAAMVGVFFLFVALMKRPTFLGRKVLDEMLGFKDYLEIAEKDELNLRNPPQKTPALFEIYLPFALALGVEQPWAEQFASVFANLRSRGDSYQPAWYHGDWNSASLRHTTASLTNGLNSAISSSVTPPGSSSGGGGGGFSGGGGGGGGGGGW